MPADVLFFESVLFSCFDYYLLLSLDLLQKVLIKFCLTHSILNRTSGSFLTLKSYYLAFIYFHYSSLRRLNILKLRKKSFLTFESSRLILVQNQRNFIFYLFSGSFDLCLLLLYLDSSSISYSRGINRFFSTVDKRNSFDSYCLTTSSTVWTLRTLSSKSNIILLWTSSKFTKVNFIGF